MASNLITKKCTWIASETIKYVICLWDWGLLPEADEEKEIKVIDLTEESRDNNYIIEHAVYLYLLSLEEQRAEEWLQCKEKDKTEALCIVASTTIKDNWIVANERRLDHRRIALITVQKEALVELAREYK